MLNQQAKKLIQEAIELLSVASISQPVIDNATNLIKTACESIKNEKEENKEIVLNESNLELYVGDTFQLIATVKNSNSLVCWESYNTGFATVNETGLVTCIHKGELVIKVYLADNPTIHALCNLKVINKNEVEEEPVTREIDGILINVEIDEMQVGEDIGIVATCLPYDVYGENPYTLTSSDENIVKVTSNQIATAIAPGNVTITATTPNGYSDSITFNVVEATAEPTMLEDEIYEVNPASFGLVDGEVSAEQAIKNTRGINTLLDYGKRHGFKKILMPNNKIYQCDPKTSISCRSNLILDLNQSTLQIKPNAYQNYCLINFKESDYLNVVEHMIYEDDILNFNQQFIVDKEMVHKSNAIYIGTYPAKDDTNQLFSTIDKNETFKMSYSIKVLSKTPIEESTGSSLSCAVSIEYYNDDTFVATKSYGNMWIRSYTGELDSIVSNDNISLRTEDDYNNIRISAKFTVWNCSCDVQLNEVRLCRKSKSVLENFKLCNGTILGERDYKTAYYPNWWKDSKTEGGCSIIFSEGSNNGIENLTVAKSIGFNMSSGTGTSSYGVTDKTIYVKHSNLEWGDYDEYGMPTDSTIMQRTIDMIDISKIQEHFNFGYNLGYMGYNVIRARIYDVYFYDSDKNFISRKRGIRTFRNTKKPSNAKYIHLALHWNLGEIASGNTDFGGSIGFIAEHKAPHKNYIRNCIIEDNYSTGFAQCGGTNWIIENNTFRRNGGRMPGCDIDWEDGWEYVQDDIVRNNSFESYNTLIICSGLNFVIKNNNFLGGITQYGRSLYMKWENNTFGNEDTNVRTSLSSMTDCYVGDNTFYGGTFSTGLQHGTNAKYIFIINNNTFNAVNIPYLNTRNGVLINNKLYGRPSGVTCRNDIKNCYIEGRLITNSPTITNSELKDCSISFTTGSGISPNLLIDNCKLTNFTLLYANRDFIISNCEWNNTNKHLMEVSNDTKNKHHEISNCIINMNSNTSLVLSYNIANWTGNNLYIKDNTITVPDDYTSYYFKASWRGSSTNEVSNIYILNNITNKPIELAPANHLSNCGLNFITE